MEREMQRYTSPPPGAREEAVYAHLLEAELERLRHELRQRTGELEQSRARFRDVIERNADAIVVVDRDGVIRFANAAAVELFHQQREELTGSLFGFPLTLHESTELDIADGELRVVEMRVVESEWEGATAYIASLRDITERKRAEEAARRLVAEQSARTAAETAAARFRFLADATTLLSGSLEYTQTLSTLARLCVEQVSDWAVIYMVDEQGDVQRIEVAHRDPGRQQVARELRDMPIPPGSSHPVLEVLRTGEPRVFPRVDDAQLTAMTHDERHFELARRLGVASFMIVPLIARGRAIGAIALGVSTYERTLGDADVAAANDLALRAALAVDNARLYQAAQEANEAKSNLLAVISHDLRTPLNAIVGYADLLELGIPEPIGTAALERVARIRTSSMHLVYLIDELLSFARLDAGPEELRLSDINAVAVVKEVATVVEPLAQARGLQLRLDVPEQPVLITTDADRLRQVLLNLAGNAIKYTEHGETCITLRDDERLVRIDVSDTGVGIAASDLPHVFEPFWQANPRQRTPNSGTGLGLAVVRRIVTMLGGDVTVSSEVGRGSTFSVKLRRG